MKKSISLLLALALGLGFSGCGASPASSAASPSAAPASPAVSTPAEEDQTPVALRFVTYDGKTDKTGNYVRQTQIDAFTELYPWITITLDMQNENNSTEYLKNLDLMNLSADTYDITTLPSYRDYADRAANGYFMELDGYLAAAGIDYNATYSVAGDVNGKYYGIPNNPAIYHVIINKTMLDDAGLALPEMGWTWDDYAEYATAMTTGTGASKIYGSYMHTWTEYRRFNMWTYKLDNPYINDDGTSNLDDPAFGEWLTFMKQMEDIDGSQIPYSDAKSTNMAYRDVFFTGKAAMTITGSWIYADINDTENFPRDFEVAFAPMPVWGDSPAGRTEGGCSFNVVGANSAHPEEAYLFIEWLSSQEGSDVGLEFSALKGADNSATISATVEGKEELYVLDSLTRIWNDPNLESNIVMTNPDLFTAIDDIFNIETEKFMVGGQDLETTLANIQTEGNKLIEEANR